MKKNKKIISALLSIVFYSLHFQLHQMIVFLYLRIYQLQRKKSHPLLFHLQYKNLEQLIFYGCESLTSVKINSTYLKNNPKVNVSDMLWVNFNFYSVYN